MKTLWSFLIVSFLFAGRAAYAFDSKPAGSGPDAGSTQDSSGQTGKDGKKRDKQSCVAALDKDYKEQKPQLEAALKAKDKDGKPLADYWSGECGGGKEPKEIVAALLPPGGAGGGDGRGKGGDGKPGEPPAAPAMSQDSIKAVDANLGRIGVSASDYHLLFDGQAGGLANAGAPGAGGMGAVGGKPTPANVAPAVPKMTPELVRGMLADPALKDEKRSSEALQADFRKAFEQTAHGRELLKEWKANGISGVPILVGPSPNPNEGAAFRPDGNFYTINSNQLAKSYAWAKGKSEPELAAFMASHPKERAQLVYDLQDTMLHEGWHSVQMAKYPLHGKYDIPDKDYIQLEYEAKMRAAGAYMERVEAERKAGKRTLADSDNVFVREERGEALRLAYQGPDAFNRYIKDLYLRGTNGADLADGIKLQKDRIKTAAPGEKAKLEAGLKQLESAKAYFDKHVPAVGKAETRAGPAFLIHHGMDVAGTRPNDAMNALYAGSEDARGKDPKWFESNRKQVIQSFNTAIDAEKKLMSTECKSPTPACQKREQDLNGSCKYIGRDPC